MSGLTGTLGAALVGVLCADAILSVSRSAFLGLGLLSRDRALRSAPLLGRWIGRSGSVPIGHRFLATLQIGKSVLLVLLAGALYRVALVTRFDRPVAAGLLGALAIELVVAHGLGRGLASVLGAERSFRWTAPLLVPLYLALLPITSLLPVPRRPGPDAAAGNGETPGEEVEEFIQAGRREGILEQDEGHMVRSIVEFGDTLVREVMIPRTRMVAIEVTATGADLRRRVAETMHARLPVCRGGLDQIVGIVHIKDLVRRWEEVGEDGSIEPLMRPAPFVPETKKVAELLRDFQQQRIQLAVVVDEFGGTSGLVTVEDLVEEIVGEIRDEHERREEPIRTEPSGTFLVQGGADVEEVGRHIGVELDGGDWETVGGLVAARIGRLPVVGDRLHHRGFGFEVVEADRKRVRLVRVRRLSDREGS